MKYILFIGGRVGYEALKILSPLVSIQHVFLEKEHAHENTTYSKDILVHCQDRGIPCTTQLDDASVVAICQTVQPDYLMCFGYRRMLREAVYACAGIACIGSHFAPLPRYRGFAPLNWVLLNGEPKTAVNIFFLADQVDAGDIIAREWVDIALKDDINTLTDKCLVALVPALQNAVLSLESGHPQGEKQDHSLASFTCSRNPEDGLIDWSKSSWEIYNQVRALTYPMPGAFTTYNGERLYIWQCSMVDELEYVGRICGKVIAVDRENKTFKVLTGDGSVLVTKASLDQKNPDCSADISSIRVTLGRS